MKVVVIFAHPNVDSGSLGNKIILDEIKKVEGIQVREIYKMYPNYDIDIKAEQQALLDADLIVFQFPFYWYSVPSLLKEWEDMVLEHGFAFGSTGDKLRVSSFWCQPPLVDRRNPTALPATTLSPLTNIWHR